MITPEKEKDGRRFGSDSPPPPPKRSKGKTNKDKNDADRVMETELERELSESSPSGGMPRSVSSVKLAERAKPMVFFLNSVDEALKEAICEDWAISEGARKVGRFNDGEISVVIKDSVRHRHCYVVQSTCHVGDSSVNDTLMELILTVDALRRAAAKSVCAVIPYYGYARQDRKTRSRVPISAAVVAKLLENAGCSRIISLDLHCGQIQGFFSVPVDNLYASVAFVPILARLLQNKKSKKITIVSPDAGGVERCTDFITGLQVFDIQAGLAMCIKQRKKAGEVARMDLVGASEVLGADCVIVDDIADTCGTLVLCVRELIKQGANRVWACVTHPVFSKDALEKLAACEELQQLFVCNTLPISWESPKVTVISVANIVSTAVRHQITGKSMHELFDFSRAPPPVQQPTTPGLPGYLESHMRDDESTLTALSKNKE